MSSPSDIVQTDSESRFTTIKVREPLRRWLKIEAANRGIPMYELIELLVEEATGQTPSLVGLEP